MAEWVSVVDRINPGGPSGRTSPPYITGFTVLEGIADPEIGIRITSPPRRALKDEELIQLLKLAAAVQSAQEMATRVSQMQTKVPRCIQISALGASNYALRIPICVEISTDQEMVTAHAPDFEVYGNGASEYEALDDLRSVIVEEYEFLQRNADQLGPVPASQLARLRDLVVSV